MSIRERQQRRVGPPPAVPDNAIQTWMDDVTNALNALPPLSVFSYSTPESNISAIPGTIGVNLNTASNVTKLWLKESGDTMTGWVSLTTA